jgi:hypothetical protein
MRASWNTKRPYTEDGQHIIAEMFPDYVAFYDMARGISGSIDAPLWDIETPRDLRRYVMQAYDSGQYKGDRRASEFFTAFYLAFRDDAALYQEILTINA